MPPRPQRDSSTAALMTDDIDRFPSAAARARISSIILGSTANANVVIVMIAASLFTLNRRRSEHRQFEHSMGGVAQNGKGGSAKACDAHTAAMASTQSAEQRRSKPTVIFITYLLARPS
jgi:hypothetical protein